MFIEIYSHNVQLSMKAKLNFQSIFIGSRVEGIHYKNLTFLGHSPLLPLNSRSNEMFLPHITQPRYLAIMVTS